MTNLLLNWRPLMMVLAMLACLPGQVDAKVSPSNMFGSHMVLQQEMKVPVWGTADAGEEVSVSFAGQTVKTKTDAQGKWMVHLSPLKAAPNQTGQKLVIQGSEANDTTTFDDVLVGEVWFLSGQSNMEMRVRQVDNAEAEIAAGDHPQMRLFTVKDDYTARQPKTTLEGEWAASSPETIRQFSASGYFFGLNLHKKLGVPIGLIDCAVGNTPVQAWTSGQAVSAVDEGLAKEYVDLVYPGKQLDINLVKYANYHIDHPKAVSELAKLIADEQDTKKHVSPDIDDSGWEETSLSRFWVPSGLHLYTGMMWYRKTIDVPASWAEKDLSLHLGQLAGIDQTWFNGQKVGGMGSVEPLNTEGNNVKRVYTVPGRLVKAGRNVVVIQMTQLDNWTRAIARRPADMYLELPGSDDASVSMSDMWKYEKAFPMDAKLLYPHTITRPAVLFNGMVAPVIPFAVRGALWYQGEWNAAAFGRAYQYQKLLPAFVNDWRSRWGQEKFEFIIVQLPNLGRTVPPTPYNDRWPVLRHAQTITAKALPDTHLVVTFDIGNPADIHPTNKQEFGYRMALVAEEKVYRLDVVSSGPQYKSSEIIGSKVVIHLDNIQGGLVQKGDKVEGFGLAGADGKFVWADGVMEGDTVVVSSPQIASPVYVNYAWAGNPPSTVYNKAGLPLAPFTTLPEVKQ